VAVQLLNSSSHHNSSAANSSADGRKRVASDKKVKKSNITSSVERHSNLKIINSNSSYGPISLALQNELSQKKKKGTGFTPSENLAAKLNKI
jgi:hypothetical protein